MRYGLISALVVATFLISVNANAECKCLNAAKAAAKTCTEIIEGYKARTTSANTFKGPVTCSSGCEADGTCKVEIPNKLINWCNSVGKTKGACQKDIEHKIPEGIVLELKD